MLTFMRYSVSIRSTKSNGTINSKYWEISFHELLIKRNFQSIQIKEFLGMEGRRVGVSKSRDHEIVAVCHEH